MIPDDHLALIEAARAIASGRRVDWKAIESSAGITDSLSNLLQQLKLVEEIAALHRSFIDKAIVVEAGGVSGDRRNTAAGELPAWGTLTLLEHVGKGAFGDVFRAWDPRLEREVALKLLRQSPASGGAAARIVIDEAKLLARVRHPNVVTVYGADRIDGQVGLWMEFVRGRTIDAVLQEHGPMGAPEAGLIGLDVCRALSAVHRAGLIHRDVKAHNVMRETGGRIVLMDFGAGHEDGLANDAAGLAGTPLYLAPEVFAGAAATPRSDVYSVGVLLYHLATGSYPVKGRTVGELREAHRGRQHSWLRDERPDLPDAFVRAVERALAPDPAERYDSAGEMEAALARVVSHAHEGRAVPAPGTAIPVGPVRRAGFGGRRAALAVAAAVALVASAAVFRRPLLDLVTSRRTPSGREAALIAIPPSSVSMRHILLDGFSYIGTPSADGQWFSYSDENGNVALLNIATGQRRQVTSDASGSPSGNQFATASTISHDGRSIAYEWSALDGADELRISDLQGAHPRVLLRDAAIEHSVPLQWSHDGQSILALLVRAESTDLALIATDDGSVRVLEKLSTWPIFASISPDDHYVVYDGPQSAAATARDIFIVESDGSNAHRLVQHPSNDAQPVWTADGHGIVFVSDRSGSNDLWEVDVAGGFATSEPHMLHRNVGRMLLRGLTDAGVYFLYLTVGIVDVYKAPLTGHGFTRATPVANSYAGSNISSLWSPDGRQIAYASRRGVTWFDQGSTSLVITDLASGTQRELQPALSSFLLKAWSPDGRHLIVGGLGSAGQQGPFVIDATTGVVVPLQPGFRPDWLSDGRITFIQKAKQRIIARDMTSGMDDVLLDGHAEGFSLGGNVFGRGYRVSPDGQLLAFTASRGDGDAQRGTLAVRPLHGGATRELVTARDPELLMFQDWMPDGTAVLFTRWNGKSPQSEVSLWRVSIDGGDPQPLGSMVGLRDVSVDRAGTTITFTAGWPVNELWAIEHLLTPR